MTKRRMISKIFTSCTLRLLIFGLLLAVSTISAQDRKKLTFLQVIVQSNPEYFRKHIVEIEPNRTSLGVVLDIVRDFPRDVWLHLVVALREPKTQQYHVIFSYNINVCQILGKPVLDKANLVQLWIRNFWKYGTLPKRCPIKKGYYSWRGLRMDRVSLPGFLLSGRYRAYLNSYFPANSQAPHQMGANLTVYMQLK